MNENQNTNCSPETPHHRADEIQIREKVLMDVSRMVDPEKVRDVAERLMLEYAMLVVLRTDQEYAVYHAAEANADRFFPGLNLFPGRVYSKSAHPHDT